MTHDTTPIGATLPVTDEALNEMVRIIRSYDHIPATFHGCKEMAKQLLAAAPPPATPATPDRSAATGVAGSPMIPPDEYDTSMTPDGLQCQIDEVRDRLDAHDAALVEVRELATEAKDMVDRLWAERFPDGRETPPDPAPETDFGEEAMIDHMVQHLQENGGKLNPWTPEAEAEDAAWERAARADRVRLRGQDDWDQLAPDIQQSYIEHAKATVANVVAEGLVPRPSLVVTELPEWVQEVRMYRDYLDRNGKDWWIVGLSTGYDREGERREVGEGYTWGEALAQAVAHAPAAASPPVESTSPPPPPGNQYVGEPLDVEVSGIFR